MDEWTKNMPNKGSLAEIVKNYTVEQMATLLSKTPVNNFALVGQAISPKRARRPSSESVCNAKGLLIQLPTS